VKMSQKGDKWEGKRMKKMITFILGIVLCFGMMPTALAGSVPTVEESLGHFSVEVSNRIWDKDGRYDYYNIPLAENGTAEGETPVLAGTTRGVYRIDPETQFCVSNTAGSGTDCYLYVDLMAYQMADLGETEAFKADSVWSTPLMEDAFVNGDYIRSYDTLVVLEPGESYTFDLTARYADAPGASVDKYRKYEDGTLILLYINMIYPGLGSAPGTDYRRYFWDNYLLDGTVEAGQLPVRNAPSSWAREEIAAAYAAGIVPELSGSPMFKENITREQFAELVVQMLSVVCGKEMAEAPAGVFVDTGSAAVRKAYAAGIVDGIGGGRFAPEKQATREQIAVMLLRTIQYIRAEIGVELVTEAPALQGFSDADQVSGWAAESVGTLAANGIMEGSSGKLSPKNPCTVEQSILLLYRLYARCVES